MSTHIVNVAFDFDDDKVRKILEDSAEQKVIEDIKKDISRAVIGNRNNYLTYGKTYEDKLKEMVSDNIDSVLEDYKDLIIKAAADRLAERFSKTKAFKDKMKEAMEGGVNDTGEVQ